MKANYEQVIFLPATRSWKKIVMAYPSHWPARIWARLFGWRFIG